MTKKVLPLTLTILTVGLIIADKAGGFTTSSTNDYSDPVETIDKDGNKEVKSFQDKTVSATIGEIKEALKNN